MTSRQIIPFLAILAVALAGCGSAQQIASSDQPEPHVNWITPSPVHSMVGAGSVSDAASGSTVLDAERR